MTKTIERQNQKIECALTLSEGGIYPKYILRTKTNGHINSYEITAKICGLNECKENSLYLTAQSVEFIGGHSVEFIGGHYTTNEESLIDSAVIDIFEELTQA
tara:strand:+ start:1312 stop:1617 length:306 start_codon:yes stop_codon:yes gene_type:complete